MVLNMEVLVPMPYHTCLQAILEHAIDLHAVKQSQVDLSYTLISFLWNQQTQGKMEYSVGRDKYTH